MFYNMLHDDDPSWGETGDGGEDSTQHIWCCNEHDVVSLIDTKGQEEPASGDGGATFIADSNNDGPLGMEGSLETYKPQWFHRPDWSGRTYPEAIEFCHNKAMVICPYAAVCPLGKDGPTVEIMVEPSAWVPISDHFNDWASVSNTNTCSLWSDFNPDHPPLLKDHDAYQDEYTRHLLCCALDEAQQELSAETGAMKPAVADDGAVDYFVNDGTSTAEILNLHQPQWFHRPDWAGTTYTDSIQFCSSMSMTLCPYEAYCPLGEDGEPHMLGTLPVEPSGSWAPVVDYFNGWVGISESETACTLWSDWNNVPLLLTDTLDGTQEEITRHIMCCATQPDESGPFVIPAGSAPKPPSEADKEDAREYNPQWFHRQDGWEGTSYAAAADFCKSKHGGLEICPFEAICPDRINESPFGVTFNAEGPEGSWAPVFDRYNEWVQISSTSSCVLYSYMHGEAPDWGLHGDEEELTRHVSCCNPVSELPEESPAIPGPLEISPQTLEEQAVFEKYGPKFFDRGNGWKGATYSEALEFCYGLDGELEGYYGLCPYNALCPNGSSESPLGGTVDEEEQWTPVLDRPNQWVGISSSGFKCVIYRNSHPAPPEWGESGDDRGVTKHLTCCRIGIEGFEEVQIDGGPPSTDVATTIAATTQMTTTKATAMATAPPSTSPPTPAPVDPTTTTTTTTSTTTMATTTTTTHSAVNLNAGVIETLQATKDRYVANWYDRSKWKGQTYEEALKFCAKSGSAIPCPYEACEYICFCEYIDMYLQSA